MGVARFTGSVAALIVVGLCAGCSSGTWVVVHMSAPAGPAPEGLTLTIAVDAPSLTRQLTIGSLPAMRSLLLPDRAERVTATLRGTVAGVPFAKSATVQSAPHQERSLDLVLDGVSVADLGTMPPDLEPDHDLAQGPLPPLALVNAVKLGPKPMQVATTIMTGAQELLVVAAYWNWNLATIFVSDTANHTWKMAPGYSNPITTCSNGNGSQVQLFYAENSKPSMTTITVSETPGDNAFGAFVLVYSGVALHDALEGQSGAAANAAGNDMAVPSLATTGAGDLVVAAFTDSKGQGTMLPGAGFRTDVVDDVSYALIEDAVGVAPGMQAIGAKLPAGTSDGCWVGAAAAFKRRAM